MDPRLQEMLDHYEITKTLKEYCHGCDRCDEPRMASIYAKESWDDHGHRRATGPDYSRLMAAEVMEVTKSMYHLLGQSQIRVDGDEAGAETYFLAVCTTAGEDGVEMCNQLGGRFVDILKREDGRWRVSHRTVMRDWAISLPVEQDWTATAGLRPGARSDEDPSFAALGLKHGGARSAEGLSWR
jgi:hypothetical protein